MDDKRRTGKGRWGLRNQTNEGFPLKGSGQPFQLPDSKGGGFIGPKALDRSGWDMNGLEVEAMVLGPQCVDQVPEAEAHPANVVNTEISKKTLK